MADPRFHTSQFVVTIAGQELAVDVVPKLLEAYVETNLTIPDEFVLRFSDDDGGLIKKLGVEIGAAVTVAVSSSTQSSPQPLIDGEVTAMSADITDGVRVTEVRGMDKSHRFMRGRRVVSYPDMSLGDIVRAVADRAKIDVEKVDDVAGVCGAKNTQISQCNESDWEFLQRLAGLVGAIVRVTAKGLDFTVPTPPSGGGTPQPGDPMVIDARGPVKNLRISVNSAGQANGIDVWRWDDTTKKAEVVSAPPVPRQTKLSIDPAQIASKLNAPSLVAIDVPAQTQAAAESAAKSLAGRLTDGFVEVDGQVRGNPMLLAGKTITLKNFGDPFDVPCVLTHSRHRWSRRGGYLTEFTVSGAQDRSLYGLTSRGGAAATGRVFGLVPATVTDVRDPDKRGRVKVMFPFSPDYTSGWARTVHGGSGKQRALLAMPQVGDEVMVGFEYGHIDRPYVLGGLHNGVDVLPTTQVDLVDGSTGQVNGTFLVAPGKHRLELTHANGTESVKLTTGDDKHFLTLDAQGTKITVHGDGTVLIEGKQGITIDAGSASLSLSGNSVKVNATGSLELTASGTAKLSGSSVSIG